ncbi:unnamed protein product [Rodentolepis nana]|uniref:BHLH domain-containing protein n=1 Tax=Rodentolepis nana TaxID=102285 RepID=A0A0R3T9R9_RODNA|nr:unnamed protein product [Rodentolepis nana]
MTAAHCTFFDGSNTESFQSMQGCMRKLQLMVPKLRGQKTVKQLDLIHHVIEYIHDLELLLSEDESPPSSNKMNPITQRSEPEIVNFPPRIFIPGSMSRLPSILLQ